MTNERLQFNVIPIKYNKTIKEYNSYYSTTLYKAESKNTVKVKLIFKSYTKFHLFKLNTSKEFKGELFINFI